VALDRWHSSSNGFDRVGSGRSDRETWRRGDGETGTRAAQGRQLLAALPVRYGER
jgi:hypothetical protein